VKILSGHSFHGVQYSTVQGFLEKLVTTQSRNSLVLKDLERSSYSQNPTIRPCPEPAESSLYSHAVLYISIL
jgi:hypothetical protein